jgi:hypothetical protein
MKTTITTICLAIILYFSFSTAVSAVDVRQTCIEGLDENSDLIFSQSEYNKLLNDCVKKFSSYETKSYSSSSTWKEDPKYGKRRSVLVTVLKWFGILVLGFFVFGIIAAVSSKDVDNTPPRATTPKPPKLSQKELEEKQARQKENKKKRLAKQKAELERMTKIINENKAKKNKKK